MRGLLAVIAVLVAVSAFAQGGSPLTESAYTLPPNAVTAATDWRFWDGGGNYTGSALLRVGVTDRSEVTFSYVDFDIEGDDPIGSGSNRAVRRSDFSALGFKAKIRLWDTDRPAVALLLGADFPTSRRTGTNTATGGYAVADGPIAVLGIAFQWGDNDSRWRWILQPQLTMFDDYWDIPGGGRIEGFGNVFSLALGARYRLTDTFTLFGDVAAILGGDNSIDEDTASPDDEVLWAAGLSWRRPGSRWAVDIFATDSSGAGPASAIIATPDGSVAFGVGIRADL